MEKQKYVVKWSEKNIRELGTLLKMRVGTLSLIHTQSNTSLSPVLSLFLSLFQRLAAPNFIFFSFISFFLLFFFSLSFFSLLFLFSVYFFLSLYLQDKAFKAVEKSSISYASSPKTLALFLSPRARREFSFNSRWNWRILSNSPCLHCRSSQEPWTITTIPIRETISPETRAGHWELSPTVSTSSAVIRRAVF